MSRRCYVATRFAGADEAEAVAQQLRMAGCVVTSRWHHRKEDEAAERDAVQRRRISDENHADIRAADAILVLAHPDCRNTWVELQAAYGYGHTCIVVGTPFDVLLLNDREHVVYARDVDEAIGLLRDPTHGRGRAA